MNDSESKKTIALIHGDPAGIGPELMVRLLCEQKCRQQVNVVVIGDPRVLSLGEKQTGLKVPKVSHVDDSGHLEFEDGAALHVNMVVDDIDSVAVGKVSAAGGRSSIMGLRKAFDFASKGVVDGIVFMPFNKESMHLGGNEFADELGFARDYFKLTTPASEFNVANGMWNGRVTSHVAMRDVPGLLTIERIGDSIDLAQHTLKMAGYEQPRIVVAAYNPHAGDGGLMGDEEDRVIRPAVETAKSKGIDATGPLPADTLWLKVRDGEFDAVVTMYHDQGQIAIKLLGFDKGVSVLSGLPIPLTTPAHGTAFDIAGKNKANTVPSMNAFAMCVNMASNSNALEGLSGSRDDAGPVSETAN